MQTVEVSTLAPELPKSPEKGLWGVQDVLHISGVRLKPEKLTLSPVLGSRKI